MRKLELDKDDLLVSFDVVSLFTKVTVEEALEVIADQLEKDENLQDRTSITIEEIVSLTELHLKTTCFQFKEKFYEQIDGAAMGSLLSPI